MAGAEPQHQQPGESKDERQTGVEQRLESDDRGVALQILLILTSEPLCLDRLATIRSNDANASQRLLHHRAQGRQLGLDLLGLAIDRAAEALDRHRNQRQRQQRRQCQPGINRQHEYHRHHEDDARVAHVHDGRPHHHPHRVEVVCRARHQVAGAVGVEVGQRQPLHVVKEKVAEFVLN